MKYKILICKDCGFSVEVRCGSLISTRRLYKIVKEHLITASLFGCTSCTSRLRSLLHEIKPRKENFINIEEIRLAA
ncbi:hypothetical protein ACFL6D_00640 [Spirochaetota bacterium]